MRQSGKRSKQFKSKERQRKSLGRAIWRSLYVPPYVFKTLSCTLYFDRYNHVDVASTFVQSCFCYLKSMTVSYQCVSLTPELTPGVLGAFDNKLPPPFCASPSAAYFLRSDMEIELSADSSVAWRKTLQEHNDQPKRTSRIG